MKLEMLRNGRPSKVAALAEPGGLGTRKRPRRSVREGVRPATSNEKVRGPRISTRPEVAISRGAGMAAGVRDRPPKIDGEARRRVLAAMLREERWAREALPPARSGSRDLADAAQETEEEIVKVATLERQRQMLAQADTALCRLAAGRYGVCVDCGEPIPAARLHALLFAVRCRPCQERFEWRRGPAARRSP